MAAYQKFIPEGRPSNGAHVTFSVSDRGDVSMRVLSAGMRYLRENGDPIKAGDRINFYHDPDSGKLAVRREDSGMFTLKTNSPKSPNLRVSSKALGELVKETTYYRMDREKEFAVVLVPMR